MAVGEGWPVAKLVANVSPTLVTRYNTNYGSWHQLQHKNTNYVCDQTSVNESIVLLWGGIGILSMSIEIIDVSFMPISYFSGAQNNFAEIILSPKFGILKNMASYLNAKTLIFTFCTNLVSNLLKPPNPQFKSPPIMTMFPWFEGILAH